MKKRFLTVNMTIGVYAGAHSQKETDALDSNVIEMLDMLDSIQDLVEGFDVISDLDLLSDMEIIVHLSGAS